MGSRCRRFDVELTAISESENVSWEKQVRGGDRTALAALFAAHEARLKRWVDLRVDPRLRSRLSPSDVVQEIYLAAEQRLEHFRERPDMPFSVWIRLLAGQRLIDLHRRHLGAEARDAGREVTLLRAGGATSSANLAAGLAGNLTSPSQAAIRHELQEMLAQAVDGMDDIDREVLALRHFDELTNDEVAQLLGIPKSTASKRYVRALDRLRTILINVPGLLDNLP